MNSQMIADSGVPKPPQSDSQQSQTAQDYIASQLQLEADAREALPYQFDTCTKPLGQLRQSVFSCLTCNPPSADSSKPYTPAGVCYSCSISCHGEHELVELFTRRNFVCDCGTARLPSTSPCSLRIDETTGMKGDMHSEEPAATNSYNQNYRNHFCGCGKLYDAFQQKGTMFQCLGLGTVENGGCGEDWWHPHCVMGLPDDWQEQEKDNIRGATGHAERLSRDGITPSEDRSSPPLTSANRHVNGAALPNNHTIDAPDEDETVAEDVPLPLGFPPEDDFEHFLCYKCVKAFPWITRYAGTSGFLPAVNNYTRDTLAATATKVADLHNESHEKKDPKLAAHSMSTPATGSAFKRKRSPDNDTETAGSDPVARKVKSSDGDTTNATSQLEALPQPQPPTCKYDTLPSSPDGPISLFLAEDFRDHLCHCRIHFPLLLPHPQLLEEESNYSPPISRTTSPAPNSQAQQQHVPPIGSTRTHSTGSKSLLEAGEAALMSNMDRARALEGVMAYNKLRDGLKGFLKPFAESGKAVSAEDIKGHFERLRGDDMGLPGPGGEPAVGGSEDGGGAGGEDGDGRREQSGY